jgi:putative endonuclease
MPFFVYILECADRTLYIGSTNDLIRRLRQHNELKSGAHYTKIRRPVVMRYTEKYKNRSLALKREIELKTWPRNKKIELIKNYE